MKLPSDVAPGNGYGIVTAPHMAASASAFTELARLATVDSMSAGAHPLYVRLSHFEHGAALNLQLYGFSVLPAVQEPIIRQEIPGVKKKPPAAGLRSPDAVSAGDPLIWAIVANHPVAVQIEHTIAMLATLVARQELRPADRKIDISKIDKLAAEADTRSTTAVTDTLRSQGWRAAAEAVRARSEAAGFPLAVKYSPVLMDTETLARRAPILRRVYNEIPEIRTAVDKVAAMLSQSLMAVGEGSERVVAFARDLLDIGATRTYLAHLARDAFVCGNGYLSFGTVYDEDIRLLLPEQVTILGPGVAQVTSGNSKVVYDQLLHETGAEQQDSPYGLSVLEPFVHLLNERELMQERIEIAEAWDKLPAPEPARSEALRLVPLARRRLDEITRTISVVLGAPQDLKIDAPADLYFPGHELMSPAAAGLALVDSEPTGGMAVREHG